MRKVISIIVFALLSGVVYGLTTYDQEYELNKSGYAANKHGLGTLVSKSQNLLVAKYSYAVQGGSTTSDIILRRNLGVSGSAGWATLPNNAIIQHVWIDSITTPTTAGTNGTIALSVQSAGDLLAATALASFTGRTQGIPKGATVTSYIKIATAGEAPIRMSVAKSSAGQASPLSAGKFNVYIMYVLGD